MSLSLAKLLLEAPKKKRNRAEIIAMQPDLEYNDGRTKQSFKDATDINKIMARFAITGTISHVAQYEGSYSDYSDFDFREQLTKLTQGREIFDALPAEIRREFGQSPAAFFDYVNDPANALKENYGLPALAKPGQQLPKRTAFTEPTETVETPPETPPETAPEKPPEIPPETPPG